MLVTHRFLKLGHKMGLVVKALEYVLIRRQWGTKVIPNEYKL
jgi:hypothetical protein